MSLIEEKNRTKDILARLNQSKDNIDNTLIELGGQKSTSMADIPNKITNSFFSNYKKFAVGDIEKTIVFKNQKPYDPDLIQSEKIKLSIPLNLSFEPSRFILFFHEGYDWERGHYTKFNISLDSKFNNTPKTGIKVEDALYVVSVSQNEAVLCSHVSGSLNSQRCSYLRPPIHWIALGE